MASFTGKNPFIIPRPQRYPGGFNAETLTGTHTLTYRDSQFQALDPGGASRNLNMPAAGSRLGHFFWIANKANAAETLYCNQADGSTTIVNIDQNEAALIYATADGAASGTSGWTLFAVFTIAIS